MKAEGQSSAVIPLKALPAPEGQMQPGAASAPLHSKCMPLEC